MAGLGPLARYTLDPMDILWSDTTRFRVWKSVASAQAVVGLPKNEDVIMLSELLAYPVPTPEQVAEAELTTRHDVAAFLKVWREPMTHEHASLTHWGLTSSDLVDTAQAVILDQANGAVLAAGDALVRALAIRALDTWQLRRLGRTHGQPAEPTTLGYQLARHTISISMSLHRLQSTGEDLQLVKMSGPVGGYRMRSVDEERRAARMIGSDFKAAEVASQRLPREAHARWVSELAILASAVEDLVLQIRLGQQFGIEELAEPQGADQIGSSSMPHKRNPIRSETLTGLARLVRAQVVPVLENIPSWGDRDITHSSVERVALQTSSTLTHYMVWSAAGLLGGLRVDGERMARNLKDAGHVVHSATTKAELVRSGTPTHAADWATNKVIEKYTNSDYDFPFPAPPMRVEHVRELMEDLLK